jgi:phosphoglycerate dehydrogenase-like enzyme
MFSNQTKVLRGLHSHISKLVRHQSDLAEKKIGIIGIGQVGQSSIKQLLFFVDFSFFLKTLFM